MLKEAFRQAKQLQERLRLSYRLSDGLSERDDAAARETPGCVRCPIAVKSQRLVALFLLGVLLFNYPLLALFNLAGEAFGIPVLYVYIFVRVGAADRPARARDRALALAPSARIAPGPPCCRAG